MRKYFLELFEIGLVDSEGRINSEHMTSDALMTSMKTMEELTKMKMDRLVLETAMEMIQHLPLTAEKLIYLQKNYG